MILRLSAKKFGNIYPPLLKRFFYDSTTRNDTIFAPLATIQAPKGSPLGVIRVSGSITSQVIEKFTLLKAAKSNGSYCSGGDVKILKARHATLTKILNPRTRELIDIGLVLWFPKPNSYTGEDCCEFHFHGSQSVQANLLTSLGSLARLRPAEAGEFTRRAVENKKMSLLEAEGLHDLIASKTDHQRRMALKGLDGSTTKKYEGWTSNLIDILAHLEASIDFGEDELIGEQQVIQNCIEKLAELQDSMGKFILSSSRQRDIVQNGTRIIILGKPNAGKSTFMNLLCKQDKSIVSNLSGTTRDIIEHTLDLAGHVVTLYDTAGLKELNLNHDSLTNLSNMLDKSSIDLHDSIEKEGIKRALIAANKADVIVYLVDGSHLDCLSQEDLATKLAESLDIVSETRIKARLLHIIINKIDLNQSSPDRLNNERLIELLRSRSKFIKEKQFPNLTVDFISCASGENFDEFKNKMKYFLDSNLTASCASADLKTVKNFTNDHNYHESSFEFDYINERHLSLLESTRRHLERASRLEHEKIDKMAQHVRESLDYLSRIVGTVSNEQVIDVIFKDFCIGK